MRRRRKTSPLDCQAPATVLMMRPPPVPACLQARSDVVGDSGTGRRTTSDPNRSSGSTPSVRHGCSVRSPSPRPPAPSLRNRRAPRGLNISPAPAAMRLNLHGRPRRLPQPRPPLRTGWCPRRVNARLIHTTPSRQLLHPETTTPSSSGGTSSQTEGSNVQISSRISLE